ncbi:hypothetical protein A2774_04045 [Candidatus Roizmanbacteria bacterium RIFCSPHIGHO2_01_FULL_39_12c]|uniref:ParB/Spo0J HTH domain-containing protein n=1 Tax=Candidatus Roizmanbacteria bacterium RIFCSPHIGHO2_01_FULL_39_12c TaxID=1802031 RepID=A0A1F7GEP0_9BACT|nr:MAG: hypothetical protein A2774_04045 [Candidatus Roizmanbacteria bacterium RIFCSPHIGHO2_01_FULL_39_12c]OGK48069.1 MAG: hypothetical protein A2963_03860 [Candidatus Roizmanbacteria bacterium RIFCSPLOWO2_01_FULL_40_13]
MSALPEVDRLADEIKGETDIVKKVKLLERLVSYDNIKLKEIAGRLGVKSSYICHLLRLRRIPEAVIDGYYAKNISLSHLFIISRLKDEDKILKAYERVLIESLSVKKTEELVRDILYGIKTQGDYLTPEEKAGFISRIKNLKKNIDLNIIQTRIKSKVVVEFKGNLEYTSKRLRGFLRLFESWK